MKQLTDHPKFLDIRPILKKAFGKEIPDAIYQLNGGGSTSLMFKIQFNNQYYVLRLMGLDQPIEDRRIQVECANYAARLNIAPKCYYTDPVIGIMIM